MSNEHNQLPDPDDAYATVFEGVYKRAFFSQLASRGLQPHNQKEAEDMLQLASRLQAAERQHQQKQAEESGNFYKQALDDLNRLLGVEDANGPAQEAARRQYQQSVKSAAEQLTDDPDVYNAVLALKSAEADHIAQQYGL